MNGRQSKKLRREAKAAAARLVRERARVKNRWWLRPFLASAKAFNALGFGPSIETVKRIARRGVVAELT